ncbi:MAG TPA: hypothetical protein VJU77_13300 [Chthoniobacterales bacterium]|nr:hypothetical protein [Chthoniobacterales bacterium]
MSHQERCFRKAIVWTLGLSLPMLAVTCVLVLGLRDAIHLVATLPIQIVCGLLITALFGWIVAPRWGSACTDRLILAGFFGVLSFLVGVLSGSTVSMFLEQNFDLFAYILKPLFWVGIIGFIPAFVMGIVGAFISRHLLGRNANL